MSLRLKRHILERRQRIAQDAVLVVIARQRVENSLTGAASNAYQRYLKVERNKFFQQQRDIAQLFPGRVDIVLFVEDRLPLAIVAQAAGFQHRRQTQFGDGTTQTLKVIDRPGGSLDVIAKGIYGENQVNEADVYSTGSTVGVAARLDLDALYTRYGFPNDMLAHLFTAGARLAQVTVRTNTPLGVIVDLSAFSSSA